MLMLLRRLQADRGMTTFLVTNDRNVAKAADRVLHLHDGRVTPDGVPRSG